MNLFTKTYARDLDWFYLAATSVLKTDCDPINWKIAIEEQSVPKLQSMIDSLDKPRRSVAVMTVIPSESVWPETRGMDGYLAQQWIKLNIHRLDWPSSLVWSWDSDVIATRPFAERDFLSFNPVNPQYCRPLYFFTPYNSILPGESDKAVHRGRMEGLKQIFGLRDISFEWMRCMPMCLIPEILRCGSVRPEWAEFLRRCGIGDRSMSEFNFYGQFCSMFFPDAFEWWNTENRETWQGLFTNPKKITCQSWSHGGIPGDLRGFVERIR